MSSAGFALNSGRNTVQLQEAILGWYDNKFFTRLTLFMYSHDIIHFCTKKKEVCVNHGRLSSVSGALACRGGRGGGVAGCGFHPKCALMTAGFAQSVEQWTAEQDVIGSIPRVVHSPGSHQHLRSLDKKCASTAAGFAQLSQLSAGLRSRMLLLQS